SPLVGSSSPPRSCSSVVLPEPDAPMIATRSPLLTRNSTPRSTSTLRPASLNVFTSPTDSSTASRSFITQSLGRRLACGAERRIERGGHGQKHAHAADLGHLEGPQLRGQVAQEVHVGGQEIDVEPGLEQLHH